MFCSQCGNRVPDGSRFCSLCGTKITVEVETPTVQRTQESAPRYSASTAFDWSGVKGEPHKKYARDVVSPWSSTGLVEEKEPEVKKEEVPQQRSRTMSFIDILKKEREEKAREEEAIAARAAEEAKMMRAKEAPSVYIPPVYDDVSSPVITPFDAPMYSSTESQAYSAPSRASREPRPEVTIPPARPSADYVEANRAKLTAELSSILETEDVRPAAPVYEAPVYEEPEPTPAPVYEEPEPTPAPVYEEPAPAAPKDTAELYVEKYTDKYSDNQDVEDMYLSMEQPRIPRSARPATSPLYEEPTGAYEMPQPTYEAPVYAEPTPAPVYEAPVYAEPEPTPVYEEPAPVQPEPTPAPVYEAPVYAEPEPTPVYDEPAPVVAEPVRKERAVSGNTAEIEALKARLAELMGTSLSDQIEMPEPEVKDTFEEIVEEVATAPIEELASEAEPVEEPAVVEPATEEPAVEEPVVEEPVQEVVEEPVVATATPEPTPAPEVVEVAPEPEPEAEAEEELPLIDPTPEVEEELPLINEEVEEEAKKEAAAEVETGTDAMSVKELERDLFGEVSEEDIQAEETKKIDKFYTLYKKNEEFQKLLDEEYNKLKNESEEVPTVSAILGEDTKEEPKKEDKKETPAKEVATEVVAQPAAEIVDEDDEAPSKGGAALTVIAVVIAILLVVLLAVILVLNFAPDSAIALQIDSIIETITSYFSGVEIPGRLLL